MLAFSKSVLQRLDKPAQPLALHRVRLPPLSSRDAAATPCSRSRARAILTRWQRPAGVGGARRSTCEPHPAPAQDVLHLQAELTLTGASFARGPPRQSRGIAHASRRCTRGRADRRAVGRTAHHVVPAHTHCMQTSLATLVRLVDAQVALLGACGSTFDHRPCCVRGHNFCGNRSTSTRPHAPPR